MVQVSLVIRVEKMHPFKRIPRLGRRTPSERIVVIIGVTERAPRHDVVGIARHETPVDLLGVLRARRHGALSMRARSDTESL